MKKNDYFKIIIIIISFVFLYYSNLDSKITESYANPNVVDYTNSNYIIIHNNEPKFKDEEINTNTFEYYSELDSLGRAGVAFANIDQSLMPTK